MQFDLAAVRHVCGLSVAELAERAGLSVAALTEAEGQVEPPPAVVQAAARAVGMHVGAAMFDRLAPADALADPAADARIFTFRGPGGSLHAADLRPMLVALRAGRALAAAPGAYRSVSVPVQGTQPAQAARQGYLLAARLRADLGLGDQPIEDVVALARRLAFPVAWFAQSVSGLRAAAVLQSDRSAGAILLCRPRPIEPWSARVDVAHELCHLLFDPAEGAGAVLTLDSEAPVAHADLAESRAKGFAAELLLPIGGLRALLGAPGPPADPEAARAMVLRAARRFRATSSVTQYHLCNRGFLPRWMNGLPLVDPTELANEAVEIPEPAGVAVAGGTLPALSASVDPLLTAAQAARAAEQLRRVHAALEGAGSLLAEDRGLRGAAALANFIDAAGQAGELGSIELLLRAALDSQLDPTLLQAVVVAAARAQRGRSATWRALHAQLREQLRARGELGPQTAAWLEALA